jgi:hypothetical protein
MKATEEQFRAYIEVRDGGETNMWDVARVIELAREYSDVRLDRETCLDIMHNFADYVKEYEHVDTRR